MPSIILFDSSLSMLRPLPKTGEDEEVNHFQLAINGVTTILDYLETDCKLEYVSVVSFSSTSEILCGFTRDRAAAKAALSKIEDHGNTSLENALEFVASSFINEWGVHTPGQIVLVTDGNLGMTLSDKVLLKSRLLPFACQLHVVVIAPAEWSHIKSSVTFYKNFIRVHSDGGEVFLPEGHVNYTSVQHLCHSLAQKCYSPFITTLVCGSIKSKVNIFPAPQPFEGDHDFNHLSKTIGSQIEVCGFLDIADVANPSSLSRHLVLPFTEVAETQVKQEPREDEDEADAGKRPTLSVLMHGSLKVEGMVALVQLEDDWYGMLASWADNKKKSNLVLSIFEPGTNCLPWLGDLKLLAPLSDFSESPYGEDDSRSPFPIRTTDRRSYTQIGVVWIRPSGLQADVQKILRSARKLPEKQQQFYKELNRLRRAALSFGFYELLETLALLLERECTMLPDGTHPDAALQLTHVVKFLTSNVTRDASQNLVPLRTNFTS